MNIFKTKEFGKKNEKVIFLLAGWYMKLWSLWPLATILEKNGYYCICYAFDNNVISPNVPQTVENMLLIKNDILSKINALKKDGHKHFTIGGASLGTIIAILVANESKDISKIVLNTTGADPALNVWISGMTKDKFKKKVMNQGYTLKKLQQAWRPIIPIYNMDNLKDKKFLIYLSKKDKAIPYEENGRRLIQELDKRGYDYQLIVNTKFGHLSTTFYNVFKPSVYLKFLNN